MLSVLEKVEKKDNHILHNTLYSDGRYYEYSNNDYINNML